MSAPLPLQIDIVSDVVCPWCILGYKQLQVALDRMEGAFLVDLRWHPFELNPGMPAEGEEVRAHLERKYGKNRNAGSRDRLIQMGAAVDFHFDYFEGMRVVSTFSAHQLLHWSRSAERETELKLALFKAYFTDQKDVSDPETLADLAASAGLQRNEALGVISDQRFAEAVRNEQREWLDREVMAVPAFFFEDSYPVPGAQDPATFERVLRKIHAVKSGAR